MKRLYAYLLALVVIGAGVSYTSYVQAQAPGAAPSAPKASGRVAVFNVAKVMRDYKKWQHFAALMNQKRNMAQADLLKLRNEIADLQNKMQTELVAAKKEEIAKLIVVKQREFQDREAGLRKALDEESAGYLRNLYAEIQQCVKAIVEQQGFDLVMAYPDAISQEELNSPLYYDLKLRPPAAMPFYVSPSADMTDALVLTLNSNFPAPVGQAGAIAPAAGAPAAPKP
ncbi:MAG: OmpH family outer membrane protein [Fimbriiglobus sp.]